MQRTQRFVDNQFPLIMLDSEVEGHRVVVVGGVHGNEFMGTLVIHQLLQFLQIVRGQVFFIPMANMRGAAMGMREVPGLFNKKDVDLNTAFPGKLNGKNDADRLAFLLLKEIRSLAPTVVIDLHNWIDPSQIFTIVDRHIEADARFAAQQSEAFARYFGVPICREVPLMQYRRLRRDRSLTGALVNIAHIPAFTVELGGVVREKSIFIGIRGVLNVLKHCDMLGNAWIPRFDNAREGNLRLEEVRADGRKGVVFYHVKPGNYVVPSSRLATMTVGGRVIEINAKRAGYVLALGPLDVENENEVLVAMAVAEKEKR